LRQRYLEKIESLRRADKLLAISDYTRQEAIEALALPPQRITAIGCAYNADLFRPCPNDPEDRAALLRQYGIADRYLMYNSALEPRKNLSGLIEAYALLPMELRLSFQLVFVGAVEEQDRLIIENLARQQGCSDQLVLTGHVNDADLVRLFNGAALFVFPSLHEGFGLPALEAMACGTPTIGSNITSIPEVIGRDDALFDPRNPRAIAETIRRVLEDPAFAAQLRDYGLQRAQLFSWDHCARRTLEALDPPKENTSPLDWPQVAAQSKLRYRQLLTAIAALGPAADASLQRLASCIAANIKTAESFLRAADLGTYLRWRIEGPFDSNYSLALLNRETALALKGLGHEVALHSTEGPGDFDPSADFLASHPAVAQLYHRASSLSAETADFTSRNLYPPRVADMACRCNLLHHFAWEETGLPAQWVDDFNSHLQGITCLSDHVRTILVNNGVEVPIAVSGCGVDHWQRIEPDSTYRAGGRSFRFLHVSSCFPRKGVDVLLKAYGQCFTAADDVTLIIKTFPNPHNEVQCWLAEARAARPDYPHVLIIEDDLSDSCLKALYQQCQVLVAPSRAEGFGLPLAEAMLSGLAIVTTAWGGQMDFCNNQNAWLVDYHFAPSRSHFDLFDSVWAEPDVDHLAQCLREVYAASDEKRRSRSDAGCQALMARFQWQHVAGRLVEAARRWSRPHPLAEPRIGWLTTWNTRCGIASYSQHLINALPAPVTVLAAELPSQQTAGDNTEQLVRCWHPGHDNLQQLATAIEQRHLDTLIIQFNYYFYDFSRLASFLEHQLAAGRIVLLTMHATNDPPADPDKRLALLAPILKRCHRLLVHAVADLNRLKDLGLIDNVTLFPHGILDHQPLHLETTPQNGPLRIGSYGFFLPHKGLLELIEAVSMLLIQGHDVCLRLVNAEYPIPDSPALIEQARQLIGRRQLGNHCELYTDYLSDAQSLALLETCDLIVFPYQHTGESASGAVRYGLTSGRPVAVTPLEIFDDVAPAVQQLPGTSPQAIAEGIAEFLRPHNDTARQQTAANAQRWRESHRYSLLGNRLLGLCRALRNQA
jgi:O-antigen biosynthesis alpha-1,2-mannosyltransferase